MITWSRLLEIIKIKASRSDVQSRSWDGRIEGSHGGGLWTDGEALATVKHQDLGVSHLEEDEVGPAIHQGSGGLDHHVGIPGVKRVHPRVGIPLVIDEEASLSSVSQSMITHPDHQEW